MKRIDVSGAHVREFGSAPRPLERPTLLYVEDDEDNWQVAKLRLSSAYELVRAANSAEACDLVRARGGELSAILMDIELQRSELNGIELTQLLRGSALHRPLPSYARDLPVQSTPIVFVTAHGAKYSDAFLLRAGGDKVIAKPIDFGQLSLALTQLHLERVQHKRR